MIIFGFSKIIPTLKFLQYTYNIETNEISRNQKLFEAETKKGNVTLRILTNQFANCFFYFHENSTRGSAKC